MEQNLTFDAVNKDLDKSIMLAKDALHELDETARDINTLVVKIETLNQAWKKEHVA
jgi:hypothetical protein